ncbi:hypothetical protein SFRURICE_019732 [Spodoptera frugiperda]|nr:hypothetical protein SFRURICE_019732 [Spodoptera frugiperda]
MTIKQAHKIAKFSYTSTNCDDIYGYGANRRRPKLDSGLDTNADTDTVIGYGDWIGQMIHVWTRLNDASRLTHVRICITFDDRTKTDMTWDGPYHNSVSRSRIMIRVSFPVHICDHDTRRRYGYGDRIGQMIHVWTRL